MAGNDEGLDRVYWALTDSALFKTRARDSDEARARTEEFCRSDLYRKIHGSGVINGQIQVVEVPPVDQAFLDISDKYSYPAGVAPTVRMYSYGVFELPDSFKEQ